MTEQVGTPTREEQLVAALGHAGALVPMIGLIIPITVWITQKDCSQYLKKQSMQASVWQVIALLAYFLMMGCQFIFFVIFFIGTPFLAMSEGTDLNLVAGGGVLVFMLSFLLFMLIMAAYMFGWLVYIGFGIAGAVQSLRGTDFRYPFVGRWVINRLADDIEIHSQAETEENPGE